MHSLAKTRVRTGLLPCLLATFALCLSPLLASAEPSRFGPSLGAGGAKPVETARFSGKEQKAPKPASGIFSMGAAVRHAVSYNPSLGAAEAQARASEEGRKSAMGQFGPKLGTTYTYTKNWRESAPSSSKLPSNGTFSWSVEVSQLLFDGFNTLGTYQKQALQAESDKASLYGSELETAVAVQECFIDFLCAGENVRSLKEAADRLREQLSITTAYFQVGLRPKLDVLQAEVDLAKAEQNLVTAQNSRETLRAKLNTLLDLDVTERVAYAGKLSEPAFKRTLEQCLEKAYRTRPDLFVGYKAVEMAIKDRLIARSGYYPQIEAYYNITKSGNTPGMERAGSNSSRSTSWEVGAKLTWNLFQWGTTYFSDQKAGWLVAKARSQCRDLILQAGYDVKEKFLALREAAKRIVSSRRSVAAARETYQAALAEYQAQMGTNFDVLDASSKLLTAQSDLTGALGDYMKALANLYKAIGEYHPDLG